METMATLTQDTRNSRVLYKSRGYTVENFDNRWYIRTGNSWVADFATLNECRYWIGEQS